MNNPNKDNFLSQWLPLHNSPLIIAGPCSAETEEQVLTAAYELKKISQVRIFRAGVWKPRTRPNAFEGNGEKALPWLQRVKKETGLLTAVEVANANHVELCLKYGIDAVWIGARTTVSPFAVQEIADALKGVDIPVMVKNPINAELSLWIGALERLSGAGIKKLMAIHRGFSGPENNIFRNLPMWEIPMGLKRQYPDLPLICDPSHITGKSELIEKVCQLALDMNFDGLIIESHPNPAVAWSDARQQITPGQLDELLKKLIHRNEVNEDKKYEQALERERAKIDRLDSEIIELLLARVRVVQEIAHIKSKFNVTALQLNRMDQLMKNRSEFAKKLGLNPEYIENIFKLIHAESVRIQSDKMAHTEVNKKEPC